MNIKGTDTGKLIDVIIWIIMFAVAFQYIVRNNKSEKAKRYDTVSAVINNVYASGRGYKRATLLNISFKYNNTERRVTLRRGGYDAETYHRGDTINIYVNRENPDDIK
jgi:hypothetical protein